ncbi:TonB-dependent receptor [Caulobacter sp. S45]|uniref:TonB-dependent receptor n=1 Tax=Caulobacter sp. S45 TaxID=1641861 RepID=UPI00131B892B|nr:TonB-dependent receptor [Caulobacter sp. S45]
MTYKALRGGRRARLILLGATILAGGAASGALAQTANAQGAGGQAVAAPTSTPPASDTSAPITSAGANGLGAPAQGTTTSGTLASEVVVTGYRRALTNQATTKRSSVNFTDSIFAEDIGKFPDLNIAEALNRIPGVQLTRDVDGEGTQIQIRGLGPSFTKILLNGSQIEVASDGPLGSGSSNREVDLDMFPTELFTKLTVAKTSTADVVEGGIAGTVNMVNARPFDSPGQHITMTFEEGDRTEDNRGSPEGALIASKTWGDQFGILVGVAGAAQNFRTDGYETVGYTTPTIKCTGCGTQGQGFTFGNGNAAAATSGQSLQQLSNDLFPRLAREALIQGTRDRVSALISGEYRPMENLHFTMDALWGHADRNFNRLDEDLAIRNSTGIVPVAVTADSNNVVTQATLQNANFFNEAEPYKETVDFYNLNPSFDYKVNDWITLDGQVNYNKSTFFRTDDDFIVDTGPMTVNYSNPSNGNFPIITPSGNLNDPANAAKLDSFRIQNIKRVTEEKGAHFDATFGDKETNIKIGYAYDDAYREITAYDNSNNAQAFAAANIPNSELASLYAPGDGGVLRQSGIPAGFQSFIQPNYALLEKAANTAFFNQTAPFTLSSATATPSGTIDEATNGAYIELNGVSDFFTRKLRYNGGIRYFSTEQTIVGPQQLNGAFSFQTFKTHYDGFLPSFNAAIDLTQHLVLRIAGSRTMTRANPDLLLPGVTFSDPSGQVASQGNPTLKPYYSNNADIGGEYYTGGPGFIGLDLFAKDIDGFTQTVQSQVPFSSLNIPVSSLSSVQQLLNLQPNSPITLQTTTNVSQTLHIRGAEVTYVQPLDFLTKRLLWGLTGFGFNGNYTHIEQSSDGSAAVATGIGKNNYTLGGYYENYGVSVHITYTYLDGRVTAAAPQNNVNLPLIADPEGQLDLAANYTLPWHNKAFQITFNAININNSIQRTVFGHDNAPYSVYYPGPEYIVGMRAKF